MVSAYLLQSHLPYLCSILWPSTYMILNKNDDKVGNDDDDDGHFWNAFWYIHSTFNAFTEAVKHMLSIKWNFRLLEIPFKFIIYLYRYAKPVSFDKHTHVHNLTHKIQMTGLPFTLNNTTVGSFSIVINRFFLVASSAVLNMFSALEWNSDVNEMNLSCLHNDVASICSDRGKINSCNCVRKP